MVLSYSVLSTENWCLYIFLVLFDSYEKTHQHNDANFLLYVKPHHAFHLYIYYEINHVRHFFKLQFVNKGSNQYLSSIFKCIYFAAYSFGNVSD